MQMEVKLFVGNLAYSTTSDDLRVLFAQAGAVTQADVVMDRGTGQSRGFGFVTMGSQSDAQKAIAMFNGHSLHEREMTVNTAKAREERSGPGNRGGAFGAGGGGRQRGSRSRGGARRF
jgi:RNA recognition motif-containing protein